MLALPGTPDKGPTIPAKDCALLNPIRKIASICPTLGLRDMADRRAGGRRGSKKDHRQDHGKREQERDQQETHGRCLAPIWGVSVATR
jgi:hypothetical protein